MHINIDNKNIGPGYPTYIIAEISANHNGNFATAKEMIYQAKLAGADAVKIQTYTADTLTVNSNKDCFKISGGTLWDDKTLYELYQEAYTPWDWQPKLKEYADTIGITLFSSPFDKTSVDFLEDLNVAAYKIASFEAIDIPLLEYTASKGKPIIISTGICHEDEIHQIISTCKKVGNNQVALLKCTSAYPADLSTMNLRTISDMQKKFDAIIGLSDHSVDIIPPITAVGLGASIIEKHFILDKTKGGPDAAFSLTIDQFSEMVKAVRKTESSLGQITYEFNPANRKFARSLFVVKDIKKGEKFSEDNIRSIRPNTGLHTKYIDKVIGQVATKNISANTPLDFDMFNYSKENL